MNQMNVVIASPPGRKRENLLTMLESIELLKSIKTVDSCQDALTGLKPGNPVTVMIDYRNPKEELNKDVSELILNDAVDHIVLLQSRNAPKPHFTHFSTSEVVFDDLTVGTLSSLFRNIELNTGF